MTLYFNKLKFSSPEIALSQVWLKQTIRVGSAEKVNNVKSLQTDSRTGGRRTKSDQKSTLELLAVFIDCQNSILFYIVGKVMYCHLSIPVQLCFHLLYCSQLWKDISHPCRCFGMETRLVKERWFLLNINCIV